MIYSHLQLCNNIEKNKVKKECYLIRQDNTIYCIVYCILYGIVLSY